MLPRVKNYSVSVRKTRDTVVFLYRLVPGGCDHSYGIEVAQLAGMPPELIARAKEVLGRLEQNDLTLTRSAVRLSRKRKGLTDEEQISLFVPKQAPAPPEHPVLNELRGVDIERTTPLEALTKLEALKRQVESSEASRAEGGV
jgi:DNA mismatch repair protein MutS